MRAVGGGEGFWVAELWVRQLKIGRKSYFAKYRYLRTKLILINIFLISIFFFRFDANAPYTASAIGITTQVTRRPPIEWTLRNKNLANLYAGKVLSLLEAYFDLISGSSLHIKIQIMGRKSTENLHC